MVSLDENIFLQLLFTAVVIASLILYQLPYFHRRKIGPVPILQIIYLVFFSGLIYIFAFLYLNNVTNRPQRQPVFLGDRLLITIFLLSILYSYGGICIHTVGKTLSSYFQPPDKNNKVYQINDFFHRQLSHHLIFLGGFFGLAAASLIELNHMSVVENSLQTLLAVVSGLACGYVLVAGLKIYKQRWIELKLFFILSLLIYVLYLWRIFNQMGALFSYPVTIMTLTSMSILIFFFIFLVLIKVKKIKRPA